MNTINIYSTRTMMAAISKMMPVRTFFRDTFFSRVETFITNNIDVDFKKGKRKMAPFVAPRIGGVVMDRQGFKTVTYKVPRISPERVTTGDDLQQRMMGENIYSTRTPDQRAQELVGTDLAELDEYITRREEWMCRELLLNGKITMKGIVDDKKNEYIEQEVDYSFDNKETLLETHKWDQTTSDKLGDLKRWRLEIIQRTGRAPTVVIFSSDVVDLFINDPVVQKLFDNRNYNFGAITPTLQNDAITFVGKITSLGLEIYSYDEWFLDDDGVEQPMMPAKTIIMGRVGMGRRLYGSVTQIENKQWITIEGNRIPKMWVDESNDVTKIRISSRPLPAPEDVDDWFVAVVY